MDIQDLLSNFQSSTSEHLIDQLKGKINCLEDLDKQRKLLYDQYADKLNECDQVKSVHSEEKQEVKPVFQPVVSILKNFNKRHMKVAEAYQDALQDLADLVVP
ncbi:unnamed protein product [Calicophoron daubneyi]|uniref:Uncharacterized protein n=1 Tax=Calicophoron daubneyi TaxID=300641 RepID=A0AAV2TLS8_CALDB